MAGAYGTVLGTVWYSCRWCWSRAEFTSTSIACGSANSYNLPVSAYLKLGSPASHGCIRTCVADAKWVYENCNGSTIYIFDGIYKSDEVFKGPLGRRAITPLKGTKNRRIAMIRPIRQLNSLL